MKALLLCFLFIFSSQTAYSAVIDKEKREMIDEMMRYSDSEQLVSYMASMLTIQMLEVLTKHHGNLDQAVADIIQDEAKTLMYEEYIVNNTLNEIFYELYDENFSTEEMKEMLAFFSTKTGQHVLKTLPKIAAQSQALAKAHAKKVGPKIQMRIQKRLKEASKAVNENTAPQ
jgi:hypothetical protein